MELHIDGHRIHAAAGQSLSDLVRQIGLDAVGFADRPIAAKIAGEVFNLNYVPVREKDVGDDRPSIRRAMAASNGEVCLIRYRDSAGKNVYTRTAQFILFLALSRLWPNARTKMGCTVGKALFVEVRDVDFSVEKLKAEVKSLVKMNIPLIRKRMDIAQAITHFQKCGHADKARLLSMRKESYFDVYTYEGFADYYYGELAPSTGYLQVWNIFPMDGGFMFLFPDDNTPESAEAYDEMPNFLNVCREAQRWCELMACETVADLNAMVESGDIRELIRVNEALHEKNFSQIADMVCNQGAKAVMLAGPSSSGKTTSANRLATQLRVHGKKPILISLDDYYIDRDKILPDHEGNVDLEHIDTIDVALFRQQLAALLSGEKVILPKFDFCSGKRQWGNTLLQLERESIIIIEGLHALNPVLLPEELDCGLIFRLYVSPLIPLNLDDHNRIPTSFLRLLRRIVRDHETRGASVQQTMSMWDSVRRGESKWIFPYQEQADVILNSSTLYEPAVLKKHIFPLLTAVQPEDDCYEEIRALVKVLNYVRQADVDEDIPPTSIVREFIGGNSFYR